ncbi:YTH-domain-containing protein [Coniochaeta ligniaria NRRL 30616]|uniref:YTH-domain-containing protein n=1 Tax=Coniochaeta ligniaria NRRL 30616 TaxID=1408157 RepID=A0A1J7J5G9_9PEZI|nr:YTH-domain-containing protein [Coniochaeta ligniaria NRRL 30616]
MASLPKNGASATASPKANIDPRLAAAELKKKLLKDKNFRAGGDNTVRAEMRSSSGTATPRTLPQMPIQSSVHPDADDIAALIKSISSASQDTQVNASSRVQKIPGFGSAPHTPADKTTQSVKALRVPSPAEDGEVVAGDKPSGVANTPTRSTNTQTAGTRPVFKTNDHRTAISTPNKPEAKPSALNGAASVSSSAARLQDKKQQGRAINDDADSIASRDPYSPSSNLGRSDEAKNGKVATSLEQPDIIDQTRDISNDGSSQTTGAMLAKLMGQDQDLRDWLLYTRYFDVESRDKKLTRYRALAEMEAAEQRIKEEQERLAAARRKLLEEDDLDQSFLLHIARTGHSQTPQPFAPDTPITDVSSTKPPPATPVNESGKDTPTMKAPNVLKRGLDIEDTQEQRSKMPKLDTKAAPDSRLSTTADIGQRTERERGRDNDRDRHNTNRRRSRSFPRGESPRRHSPSRAPHDRYNKYNLDYNDENYDHRNSNHHDVGRYDAYRGKGKPGGWNRTPSPTGRYGRLSMVDPKPVDLGDKGETRFFMVKSFNEDNVRMCMDDGLWTTQLQNTETLTSAFAQCKNVILFFSINKSRAFQGYARMATAPSPDTPRPRWIKGIHWETSPPFRVEWLSTTDVEFRFIGHLLNPLNDNLPVLVGKDGQEIEEECGRKLLEEMERIVRYNNEQLFLERGPPRSPRANRGRGGYNIRGRGFKYIKHEER